MAASESKTTVIAAFVGNFAIAIAKLVVAAITGSSAMLSEGIHSIADTANQGLLLRGLTVARKGPTVAHPFGRGKEIFFWSFMVAIMLFVGGSVLSITHAIEAIREPHVPESVGLSFIVLGVAFVIEAYVLSIALKHFNSERGSRSMWRSIRVTKDAPTLVVLLEDMAALLGVAFAAAGLALAVVTDNGIWDGVASLMIGILLAVVAVVLAYETKALLIGEAASRADRSAIRMNILSVPLVESVGRLLTMHMGPDEILVNADVDLTDGLTDTQVEEAIDNIEEAIRTVWPSASNIFVELESHRG
jgi:cation diffusion facilitator family transporter